MAIPYQDLKITGESYQTLSVVPPAPAYPMTEQPLKHLRIAVEDMFHLEGLRTSFGNRAYFELSKLATKTALIIKALEKRGVYLVGLTKLSSLTSREEPAEALDC